MLTIGLGILGSSYADSPPSPATPKTDLSPTDNSSISILPERFTFDGQWNIAQERLTLNVGVNDKNAIKFDVEKTQGTDYLFTVNLEDFKTPFFHLTSEIQSALSITYPPQNLDRFLYGRLSSHASLYNSVPIRELTGSFEISEGKIKFDDIRYGSVGCDGYIRLIDPYKLDLTVKLDAVEMQDFLGFWLQSKTFESAGQVSGVIKVGGDMRGPFLRGNLYAYDGFIKKLYFSKINLNIEGNYPRMVISDSTLTKKDGIMVTINGPFNLAARKNFKNQLSALAIAPIVSDTDSERVWTIKSLEDEELGKTQIKYRLRKSILGDSAGEDAALIGVEKSMDF